MPMFTMNTTPGPSCASTTMAKHWDLVWPLFFSIFMATNKAELDGVPIVEGNGGGFMFGMSPHAHNNIVLGIANQCHFF